MDESKQDKSDEWAGSEQFAEKCPLFCIVPYWQRPYCGRCATFYAVLKNLVKENDRPKAKPKDAED